MLLGRVHVGDLELIISRLVRRHRQPELLSSIGICSRLALHLDGWRLLLGRIWPDLSRERLLGLFDTRRTMIDISVGFMAHRLLLLLLLDIRVVVR